MVLSGAISLLESEIEWSGELRKVTDWLGRARMLRTLFFSSAGEA